VALTLRDGWWTALVVDALFRSGVLWRHSTVTIFVDEQQDEIAAACRQ
jgi:hypothetical protein